MSKEGLPLEGIKVMDLTIYVAGPACSTMLGYMGADVIKVESLKGDPYRVSGKGYGMPAEPKKNPLYDACNGFKRCVAIDFRSDEGKEVLKRLAIEADIIVTNYRAKPLKGMGMDYETVSSYNKKVVYGYFSGYGDVGPDAERPGFDANYFSGWGRDYVGKMLAEKDLHLVAIFDNCFRWWSNNDHPATTIDALKGMKIRVPESEYMVAFYEAIGCQCVTIALGELAVALQQGVADAQELSPTSAYPRGYYTYQKYWTESNCGYSGAIVAINNETWDSLTAQQQEWLTEAFAAAEIEERSYAQSYMQECIDKMEAEGCEFIRGDFEGKEELTAAMIEIGKEIAVSPPYDKYFSEDTVANMYP